jgi:hydroxymethylglutaryl-CoA lyase
MAMGWPKIEFTEEAMREGMQIESADIPVAAKIELLDALSETGIKHIVVGSFVSPKYTPQMARVEEIVRGFTPKPGVTYSALVLNRRGLERAQAFVPPLTLERRMPTLLAHLCDVFIQRNTNSTQADEIARWRSVIDAALQNGVQEGAIGVGAPWGSNFCGPFSQAERLSMLQRQHDAWTAAGVEVTQLTLLDPMSWNMPHQLEADLEAVLRRWPKITRIYLHLHNARGMALTSIYAAMRVLDERHTLQVDCALGGLGGCPYCGNGRVTRMAPTEDLVHMWEEMGIDTGVDLDKLIRTVWLAEEIVGHTLWGAVSKAGPFPRGERLYSPNLPFVETEQEARHFLLGSDVIPDHAIVPWKTPIRSAQRDQIDAAILGRPEASAKTTR